LYLVHCRFVASNYHLQKDNFVVLKNFVKMTDRPAYRPPVFEIDSKLAQGRLLIADRQGPFF